MSTTAAILNQKGGVGKTTLTLGLASAAWATGTRVLVVDLDAQANATWALGVDPSPSTFGTGDALAANSTGVAGDMIVASGWSEDVWLLPAGGDLTERDTDARDATGRRRLAKALEGVGEKFDVVLIDCPPSLGLNTRNGLAAAAGAVLVVEPSVFGLRGVGPVLDLIEEVWSADNSGLDLAGVVLNRVPSVSVAARDRMAELKKMVGSKSLWTPYVPQRVLINQAHHERSPIHAFGAPARELAAVFEALLRKLRRTVTETGTGTGGHDASGKVRNAASTTSR